MSPNTEPASTASPKLANLESLASADTLLGANRQVVDRQGTKTADIAIFIRSMHGGGAERVLLNLAHDLAARGLRVDLLLARAEGHYLEQVRPEICIVDLKAPQVWNSLFPLVRYLKSVQPACLLAALHYPCEIAIAAKHIARVNTRVIVSEHNTLSIEAKGIPQLSVRLTPLAARLFYPHADGIIAVSQGVANDLAALIRRPVEHIKVIYNPVLTPDIKHKAKESVDHPWLQDKQIPVLLAVGRLHPQKDYPTLIRAFHQLRQQQPARLMILGTGPEADNLNSLIEELGLKADVQMPGFVANPYAYMAKASVVVMSSAWEGFANVLVEALAVQVPIVSTDCQSGPNEVLRKGEYGWLVPVGDSRAMAGAIAQALATGSKPAPPEWLQQFTPEVCLEKYLTLLQPT
jgi:glycosyltransferase involved in cell wall biosynthesis